LLLIVFVKARISIISRCGCRRRSGIAQALRLVAGGWLSGGQPDMLGVFACGKCDPHRLGGVSGREFR
jgi:hypothetical protein